MKRKRFFLIGLTLILLVLVGCSEEALEPSVYDQVNQLDGFKMEVKEGSLSPEGLTLILTNLTIEEAIFGEYFVLEEKVDGAWYQVPVTIKGDYGFQDIGYVLEPGKSQDFHLDWAWLYGSLKPGDYRVIKDVLDFREAGDFDQHYLAVEFSI